MLIFILIGVPGDVLAQAPVQDSYKAAGRTVPLSIDLDSIAVVTTPTLALNKAGMETLARTVLGGARSVRSIGDRTWILYVAGQNRAGLTRAARDIQARSDVRWAGLTARTHKDADLVVITDEFMVRFLPWVTRGQIDAMNTANNVQVVRSSGLIPNHFTLRDVSPLAPDAVGMANLYYADSKTIYAHPNLLVPMRPMATTLNDPRIVDQWHLAKIKAPDAWDVEMGDPAITIAVIESLGFDTNHPDLKNKLWKNPWEGGTLAGPEPFNKPNDTYGWNFGGSPPCPTPGEPADEDVCGSNDVGAPATRTLFLSTGTTTESALWHGTRVAGIAAAEGDNGMGGSGVCPGCSLMLVRLENPASMEVRAAGLAYAARMGADVINLSWGSPFYPPEDTFLDVIAEAALNGRNGRGVTIVAAADDRSDFCDFVFGGVSVPLLAADPNVISVGKTKANDTRDGLTEGPCLDLVAPGVDILSTDHLLTPGSNTLDPGDYIAADGTSYAAPIVAGVVGLMLSRNPNLDRKDIYDVLIQTAEKVGGVTYDASGHHVEYGYGRVNAYAALQQVTEVSRETVTDPSKRWEVGVRAGLTATNAATTTYDVGLPGAGPLAAPVVYVDWIGNSAWIADLQFGYAKAWGGGSGSADERRIAMALMAAYRLGNLYVGPSLAYRAVEVTGSSSTEWGWGGALGWRQPLGSQLAWRLEFVYRHWSGIPADELGLAIGLGVRLP